MKIEKVDYDYLEFDNGKTITTYHRQECYESNWADFRQLDDLAMKHDFVEPLQFRKEECGFSFGDAQRMFFVPCYSEQNGYYSYDIDVYYDGKRVLTTECEQGTQWD